MRPHPHHDIPNVSLLRHRPTPCCCHQVHVPEGLTALDLDVIKLTAQFVARNGAAFLTGLASREPANPQFHFLKPNSSLFGFFSKMADAYSAVLMPGKDLRGKLAADAGDRWVVGVWEGWGEGAVGCVGAGGLLGVGGGGGRGAVGCVGGRRALGAGRGCWVGQCGGVRSAGRLFGAWQVVSLHTSCMPGLSVGSMSALQPAPVCLLQLRHPPLLCCQSRPHVSQPFQSLVSNMPAPCRCHTLCLWPPFLCLFVKHAKNLLALHTPGQHPSGLLTHSWPAPF
jgi:hypothetical protein